MGLRLEAVREPPQRLTQHKWLGSRSLPLLWDREEAPALLLKGSKPEAVPAGWSLFSCLLPPLPRHSRGPTHQHGPPMGKPGLRQPSDADETCVDHDIGGECTSRDTDRVIAALAEQQHGVVARRQLGSLKLGRRAIEERLARGRLHPIHRGVYAVGHTVLSDKGRWIAAVLASGPGAVLSHRTAAQLWRLTRRSIRLEVTRPGYFRRRPGITAHRSSLPEDERAALDGIPVTSVPRTILDLAAVLDRRQLERAMNEVEVRGLTDRLSVPDLLSRYPRRRGTAALRAILGKEAAVRGVTVNDFEGLFAALIEATVCRHLASTRTSRFADGSSSRMRSGIARR